jgi:hypothetical protein
MREEPERHCDEPACLIDGHLPGGRFLPYPEHASVSSERSEQSPLLSEPQRYFFALAFSRAAASARTDSGSSLNWSRQPEQQTQ